MSPHRNRSIQRAMSYGTALYVTAWKSRHFPASKKTFTTIWTQRWSLMMSTLRVVFSWRVISWNGNLSRWCIPPMRRMKSTLKVAAVSLKLFRWCTHDSVEWTLSSCLLYMWSLTVIHGLLLGQLKFIFFSLGHFLWTVRWLGESAILHTISKEENSWNLKYFCFFRSWLRFIHSNDVFALSRITAQNNSFSTFNLTTRLVRPAKKNNNRWLSWIGVSMREWVKASAEKNPNDCTYIFLC